MCEWLTLKPKNWKYNDPRINDEFISKMIELNEQLEQWYIDNHYTETYLTHIRNSIKYEENREFPDNYEYKLNDQGKIVLSDYYKEFHAKEINDCLKNQYFGDHYIFNAFSNYHEFWGSDYKDKSKAIRSAKQLKAKYELAIPELKDFEIQYNYEY